jgi:hypothetical protein
VQIHRFIAALREVAAEMSGELEGFLRRDVPS